MSDPHCPSDAGTNGKRANDAIKVLLARSGMSCASLQVAAGHCEPDEPTHSSSLSVDPFDRILASGGDLPNRDITSAVAPRSVSECYSAVRDTLPNFLLTEFVFQKISDLNGGVMNRINGIAVAVNNVIQFAVSVIVEPINNVVSIVTSFGRMCDTQCCDCISKRLIRVW